MLAFVACASSHSQDGAGASDATAAAFADAFCALITPCCSGEALPDRTACHSALAEILATRIFDAAAAATCLDELKNSGTTACGVKPSQPTFSSCASVYTAHPTGSKPPGSPCQTSMECAPSYQGEAACIRAPSSPDKTCQLRVRGIEGSRCDGSTDTSLATLFLRYEDEVALVAPTDAAEITICSRPEGLYCDEASRVCETIGKNACATNDACADAEYCSDGRCLPKLTPGDPCSASAPCVADAFCGAEDRCEEQRESGALCEEPAECASRSCLGGACTDGRWLARYCGNGATPRAPP